jgi:hypothetical protein
MRIDRALRVIGAVVACTAGAAACSADDLSTAPQGEPGEGELPAAIVCGTQYRPDAESLTGAEEPELRVERPGPGEQPSAATVELPTMTLTVSFAGDAPEGRSVTVEVTSAGGEQLLRVLYQLGDLTLADVQFAGGHGFTGLHYVDHDRAQLQFWCGTG